MRLCDSVDVSSSALCFFSCTVDLRAVSYLISSVFISLTFLKWFFFPLGVESGAADILKMPLAHSVMATGALGQRPTLKVPVGQVPVTYSKEGRWDGGDAARKDVSQHCCAGKQPLLSLCSLSSGDDSGFRFKEREIGRYISKQAWLNWSRWLYQFWLCQLTEVLQGGFQGKGHCRQAFCPQGIQVVAGLEPWVATFWYVVFHSLCLGWGSRVSWTELWQEDVFICMLSGLKRARYVTDVCADRPWVTNMPMCRVRQSRNLSRSRTSLCKRPAYFCLQRAVGIKGGHQGIQLWPSLRPKRKMWKWRLFSCFSFSLVFASWGQWGAKFLGKRSFHLPVVSLQSNKDSHSSLRFIVIFV